MSANKIFSLNLFGLMALLLAASGPSAASSLHFRLIYAAHVTISPTTLNFGSVAVGAEQTLNVSVSNSRSSKVTIPGITTTGTGFRVVSAPTFPLVLSAGQSVTVTIAFKPLAAGTASGSFSVTVSGSTTPVTKPLSGVGVAASGQLSVSPAAMNFGSVELGTSQNQAGSLTATGADVTMSSGSWSGVGYSLSGISFPLTVPAGQSVSFVVTFAPQTAGSSAGSVSFTSNGSNSPAVEAFSGSGLQPVHSVGLSWNASPSTVSGYNVYRGSQPGGPYTLLNSLVQPGTTYTDSTVLAGATYFYVVTAVDSSSQESVFSNEGTTTIPIP